MRATKNIQVIALLLMIFFAGESTTLAADAPSQAGKGKQPYTIGIPVFKNEQEMKEWIRDKLNFSSSSSSVLEFERSGRKVCVALQEWGGGRVTTNIYIFITNRESGTWGIVAIWQTYTSEVKVVLSKNEKELIFKSKSGKTLFSVPFEALEPKNDPDF